MAACPLTPLQLRVLEAYARLGSCKLAARDLGLAPQTVKNTLWTVRIRLAVASTEHACYIGGRDGWLVVDDVA